MFNTIKQPLSLSLHKQAPDISLPSTSCHIFSLHRDFKDKACILFFYTRDFDRDATLEVCAFKDRFQVFKKLGIELIGISRDEISTHIHFKNTYDLPFELLSDTKREASKAYKALIPIVNCSRRITYLLDRQHQIIAVYENIFDAKKHVEYMLDHVRRLSLV